MSALTMANAASVVPVAASMAERRVERLRVNHSPIQGHSCNTACIGLTSQEV